MILLHYLVVVLLFSVSAQGDGAIGLDITGNDIIQVGASSSTTCAQLCDGRAGCLGWAWDSCGKVSCWLKSTVTGRSINSCRISDVRQGEAGFDRPGYDMPGSPASLGSGATASTCSYRCTNTTGCVAWAWTGTSCYLKWWAALPVAVSSIYSGVQGTYGLDFPYVGDLASSTLPASASPTDCAKVCEANSDCYAWSFAMVTTDCASLPNICWLKSFVPGQMKTGYSCRTAGLASRFYNTASPRTPVSVTSITPIGNQTDPSQSPIMPSRDGGTVGTLAGKIIWFWSDTGYTNVQNGAFAGFYGNTAAIGSPNNQTLMTGPIRQAIPFTVNETNFNNEYGYDPRVVLWPKSPVVEVSPGKGLVWVPKGYWGRTIPGPEPHKGIVLATVTIGSDGYPVVTRFSDVPLFPESLVPSYGSLAAVRDQKYVYLYSIDSIAQFTSVTHIARAPLDSATSLKNYQYYNNGAGRWESSPPAINNSSWSIFGSTFGLDGNIYYSSYHRAWICIFSYHADYHVQIMTAPAPQGPWSQPTLIYTPPPAPSTSYIYGTTGTNLYDTNGKSASIDFTWCYPNTYANWVAQANFS